MDYKKKYENAVKELKKFFINDDDRILYKHDIEHVFPELKESEDERIKKAVIEFVKQNKFFTHCKGVSKDDCLAWLEKQGEQKLTDKVEPKFHAGDFITDGERIFQIKETVWKRNNRNDGSTYCESLIVNLRDGNTYANNTDLKEYHLWTIQDAKDGDVLCAYPESEYPWIGIFYKSNAEGGFISHCYLQAGRNGKFCPPSGENIFGKRNVDNHSLNVVPATKEQRDLLFSKMKEAGYEWDAEKKELKKIEQNPAWSEEDEEI